MFFIIALILSV